MRKIVINACYGGFGFSDEAYEYFLKHGVPLKTFKEKEVYKEFVIYETDEGEDASPLARLRGTGYWDNRVLDQKRDDPLLVKMVEELGDKASGKYAELKIVEIPDDVEWEVEEYDGQEWVAEKHRTWR